MIRQGRLEWRAEVAVDGHGPLKPGTAVARHAGGRRRRSRARSAWSRRRSIRRRATASSTSTCRPPARAAPACSRAASSSSARLAALTLPQSAVLLRDGFSYVLRVGADTKVTQVKVDVGRRVGDRIEIIGGLGADARVVATGGGFLATATRCEWSTRRRRWPQAPPRPGAVTPPQAMITSPSWSIRNPIPAVLLFIMLTADRRDELSGDEDPELPGHRPADRHASRASLPGASPAQLETEVARKIENSIATLQGVKHIYTTVQDGAVDRSRSSSASRSRRRKRSTTCATRSRGCAPTCPPTCAIR